MSSIFSKKVTESYNNSNIKSKINVKYKGILYKLYDIIFNNYCNDIDITYNNNIIKNNTIKEIDSFIKYESNYMSKKISSTIEQYKYVHEIISSNIIIYYYSKKDKLTKSELKNIKNIIYRIECLKKYAGNTKNLNIAIYPTLFKKTINKLSKKIIPLNIDNVNSGLTYYGNNEKNGTIIIWRLEELYKVLVHELLHSIKADYGLIKNEYIFEEYMKKTYKLNKFIGINESYVETLACIINVIFFVIEKKLKKDLIIYYLKIEIYYCTCKAAQILNYYNFNSIIDLINSNDKNFDQDSNVFSYYILKTMILYNFDKVYNELNKHNCINNNIILDSEQICSEVYFNIIKMLYNNFFDKNITTIITNKNFINNSLRMTSIG